jgi:hypothetical protein
MHLTGMQNNPINKKMMIISSLHYTKQHSVTLPITVQDDTVISLLFQIMLRGIKQIY